jgi:hypothetical protein
MLRGNYSDVHIVYEALYNEIRLDQRYREIYSPKGFFIDYKIMKQLALKRKFGSLVTPIMFTLAWIMPVILFARWIQMLATSLGTSASKNNDQSIWIVPTISTNESLIRAALTRGRRTDLPQFTLYNLTDVLPLCMDFNALLISGWQTLLLVLRITLFGTNRTALLLHARDSTNMLLLAKFARSHPNDLFATDCHYQRWSFILSHTARDLTLVQHGILDSDVDLPRRGGEVRQIIVRDEPSAKSWLKYYRSIEETTIFIPVIELDHNSFSHTAVFLASSFPTIDLEISFAQALRQKGLAPLIVKLHPAHRYDDRRFNLLSLADYVCYPSENPSCAVFVSHSSSMEAIYRQHSIPTVSILQEGTTDVAVATVMRILNNKILP